jgi:V8-like Glu-specific endopeptidase
MGRILALAVLLAFSVSSPAHAQPGFPTAAPDEQSGLAAISVDALIPRQASEHGRNSAANVPVSFEDKHKQSPLEPIPRPVLNGLLRESIPRIEIPGDGHADARRAALDAKYPTLIGSAVSVPALSAPLGFGATELTTTLHHLPADNSRSLAMRIQAPGAVGLRLGLLISRLPQSVSLSFYSADSDEAVAPAVTGKDINRLLSANWAAGDTSNAGRTYWSPTIDGEEAIVVATLPEDVDPDDLVFSIPVVSRIFQAAFPQSSTVANASLENPPSLLRDALSCHLDVNCYPDWSHEANGIAAMVYTANGRTYLCTGALLNDLDATQTPYFLSANHCISTQTAASSLETKWFYQSRGCDQFGTDPSARTLYGGARLLHASADTDVSFLQLNEQPPAGAVFLGWSTADPGLGAELVGIHHPAGDLQKISFAEMRGYNICSPAEEDGYFNCSSASSANGSYLRVNWQLGITESGSSGSPILDEERRVIGQLYGGSSSCSSSGPDYYGRFATSYQTALNRWLGEGTGEEEHGHSIETAIPVDANSTTPASLSANETTYYRIDLTSPGTLTLYTLGDTDTRGTLLDANADVIASNDDATTTNLNFRIARDLSANSYYLRVSGYRETTEGDYTLIASFTDADEVTGTTVYLDAGNNRVSLNGIANETRRYLDFGGLDTYSLSAPPLGPIKVVDRQESIVNLAAGLRVDAAEFAADGLRLTIDGQTLTLLGNLDAFIFVLGGDPSNPSAGREHTYGETAVVFGTDIPAAGADPVEAGILGTIQADGSLAP